MPAHPSKSSASDVQLSRPRDSSRDLLLQAYDSILTPRSAIYCSAPITSGRRYLRWLASRPERRTIDDLSESERALHRSQVIEPNRAHARQAAERLRLRTGKPVIDPTAVGPIDGWRQPDWIAFWEEVIARFAFEVVLIDGWEFSYGCTHEFWFAQSRGLPCLDESAEVISPAPAAERIRAAIGELERVGADASNLHRVLELLRGVRP